MDERRKIAQAITRAYGKKLDYVVRMELLHFPEEEFPYYSDRGQVMYDPEDGYSVDPQIHDAECDLRQWDFSKTFSLARLQAEVAEFVNVSVNEYLIREES